MISANTLWFATFLIVVVYLVARWARSRTQTTDEAAQIEEVRYLVRSSKHNSGEHLGGAGGLLVSDYSFRDTDATHGPSDAGDFYDELFINLRDPESGQTWQNTIHVATPRGLDRMMVAEHWDTVIGGELLIVRRFDRDTILRGAIDHLQEIYESQVTMLGHKPEPPQRV